MNPINRQDVAAYLERIRYKETLTPTIKTLLSNLHRSHLFAVPFEHLDIHAGVLLHLVYRALDDEEMGRIPLHSLNNLRPSCSIRDGCLERLCPITASDYHHHWVQKPA
ncbi:MAG: hypothetical protein AAFW75_13855 [Cyanobacteria bacterium J06636_16]